MSDRTQGSVRTGSVDGPSSGAAPQGGAGNPPVTSTQAIPGTGAMRAQAPGTGSVPVAPQPLGSSGAGSGSAGPGGSPATNPATSTSSATSAMSGTQAAEPADGGRGRGRGGKAAGRGPRRARLQLRHIDIWSAFKISFVLSIALFFIWMVAVGVLYGVLSALGVFDTLNDLFGQLGSASGNEVGGDVVTPGVVFGGAAIIGAVNIVLFTALCTVATFIYNLCSDLVGGLELTLSERD
jgi:hypothetical protein